MEIEKAKVIERIREAKEKYDLNYATLARETGIEPISIYMFLNGAYKMSRTKQLKVLCYIEKYIEAVNEQLKILEKKEIKL